MKAPAIQYGGFKMRVENLINNFKLFCSPNNQYNIKTVNEIVNLFKQVTRISWLSVNDRKKQLRVFLSLIFFTSSNLFAWF